MSEQRQGTSMEGGSSSCCIILFGMLFLFPGSILPCISPRLSSIMHTHILLNRELLWRKQPLTDAPNPKKKENEKPKKYQGLTTSFTTSCPQNKGLFPGGSWPQSASGPSADSGQHSETKKSRNRCDSTCQSRVVWAFGVFSESPVCQRRGS